MLPRIKHLPATCKEFFQRFRRKMEPAHFGHFWRLVVFIAVLQRRHHVLRLASISQLQQRLRAAVWDDFVQRLENRPKQRSVARRIEELLQNCG